jgi:hypothetical protein
VGASLVWQRWCAWWWQDALAVAVFSTSEEAFSADDLFSAYRKGDADAVRSLIGSRSLFVNLDNQVGPALWAVSMAGVPIAGVLV